jgi:hypothetical protein
MLYRLLAVLALIAIPAHAQQPPSPERVLAACQAQRNWALDQHANVAAALGEAQAEVERLKAEVQNLKEAAGKPK